MALEAQVDITADASGVEAGVGRAKRSLADLGKSADAASRQGKTGMAAMGSGAGQAAQQIDRHTRSVVNSIQRQIAAAEAGGKGTAAYYREIANQRGLKLDVLEPYLRQLDDVAAKQRGSGVEMAAFEARAQSLGMSVGQLKAATRGLPAQFTDIAVSLQGGQAPLTVLLQQGGQLKDLFGGIGPAARAMGGYVMGLVNPFTLAAGAATGLAVAYHAGWQESDQINRSLVASGQAAGVTAGEMQSLASEIASATGQYGAAREASVLLASAGISGSASLRTAMRGVVDGVEVTGRSVEDLVDEFADLEKEPTKAIIKLNEEQRFLTAAVLETIQALEKQGRATEAADLAQKTYADSLAERKGEILANVGSIERAWMRVKSAISGAWDAVKDLGRDEGPIAALKEELASADMAVRRQQDAIRLLKEHDIKVTEQDQRSLNFAKAKAQGLRDEIAILEGMGEAERERNRIQQAGAAAVTKVSEAYEDARSNTEKMNAELREFRKSIADIRAANPESALLDPAKIEAAEKAIREKYKDKGGSGGITGGSENEQANARARIKNLQDEAQALDVAYEAMLRGATASDKLLESQKALNQVNEKLKATTDAGTRSRLQALKAEIEQWNAQEKSTETLRERNKIQEQFEKERQRAIDSQIRETASISEKAQKLEDEIAVYGMGKAAVEAMIIARLEERAAAIAMFDPQSKLLELLKLEIEERKRLAKATGQKEVLDANTKAAEAATRDWKRMTDEVGQSLTDAIFDGGKSGKELVEDLFRTMILRPVVQPIVQGGMNAIGSALGIPGAPDSGLSSGGGILGTANNLKTLYSGLTGGLTSTLASGVSAIGNAIGSSAVSSFALGMQGNTLAAGLMGPTTAAAGGAMGAGAMLASAMPWVAGGLAVASLVSSMFNEAEARYGGTYTYRPGQGTERPGWAAGDAGPQAMQFADSLLRNASDAVQRAFAAAGSDAILTAFEASFESSEKGRGGTHSGGTIVIDGHEISFGTSRKGEGHGGRNGTLEEMMRNAEIDTYQTVIQGLQAGIEEFPRIARGMLEGVDADSLGLQDAQALILAFVQSLEQIRALSDALGSLPWVPATAKTYDYAAALAEATGGAEQAASLVAGFYQGYVSEAQRVADLTADVTSRFAELGMTVPQTREEMLGLVQANMALGEAGAGTTAKLLTLGDDLLTIITAAEQEAARVAQERLGLEGQLLQLLGNTVELRRRELAGLDESNRALQENIWALEDQARAAELARDMAERSAADAVSILRNAIDRRKTELQKAFDTVADGLNIAIDASQSTLSNLQSLAGSLKSTLDTMAGQFDPVVNRTAAQARIAQALATAQMTGVMPNAEDLQAALQVVAQPSEGLFSSFEDYQLDFLQTAHDISRLNGLTGDQISLEERTLNTLRDQLENATEQFEQDMAYYDQMLELAQQQLDAELNGVEVAMSVEQAIANLADKMANLKATPAPSGGGGGGSGLPSGSGYINNLYQDIFGRDVDQPGLDYWTGQLASGAITADKLAQAIREGARNEDKARRSYDVGTGYVPYDMSADIHRGEIIIDPRSSDILRRYGIGVQPTGGGNDAAMRLMQQEIQALRLMMQTKLDDIERNTYETARTNREMTEQPQQVTVAGVVSTVVAEPGK